MFRALVILIVLLCSVANCASARTWYVRRNHTGDYTTIQPAIDGAAVGDTIDIGPGRYTEYAPFTSDKGKWTENAYVAVTVDSLTLIGAGPDVTIIGPYTYHDEPPNGPKGIVSISKHLIVRDLAVMNVRNGQYFGYGFLDLENCRYEYCSDGIIGFFSGGARVRDCDFVACGGNGLISVETSNDVHVQDCVFENCSTGLSFANGSDDVQAVRCSVFGGLVGIKCASFVADARIQECVVDGPAYAGVEVRIASQVTVTDTNVDAGECDVLVRSDSVVHVNDCVFSGGSYATIYVTSRSSLEIHNSHISNDGGYSILTGAYGYEPITYLDLTNNYWGTSETDSIDAWIHDGNDESTNPNYVIVDYQPFSPVPLSTKPATGGGIRRLFR